MSSTSERSTYPGYNELKTYLKQLETKLFTSLSGHNCCGAVNPKIYSKFLKLPLLLLQLPTIFVGLWGMAFKTAPLSFPDDFNNLKIQEGNSSRARSDLGELL
ncbi:22283_t:CDS:2, partial [Racocetra persica]